VTARTEPLGAKLSLARYREDERGRLVEGNAVPLAAGERRTLEAGSYLVTAEAPGRYPTRYPFLLRRGEESALRIVLPRMEDVPEGMIYVPAGRTLYGCGDDEATRHFLGHVPRHDVEVGPFLIARTEVTNAEYMTYLEALPEPERRARLPVEGLTILPDGRLGWHHRDEALAPGELRCTGVEPCTDWSRLAVMNTNREDAERYAAWLGGSGRLPGARLCSDREWERAARGADDRRFPSGNAELGPADGCTLALYGGDILRAGPCAVGAHPASRSPFGVDDLAGNAAEWTSGVAGGAEATRGITRGAGWSEQSVELTISRRDKYAPLVRCGACGLRLCADAR
jgi:formylglycine-generating enzyme required for sulfatase activity